MIASVKLSLILVLTSSLVPQGTRAEVICEDLPTNLCSFSIASSGKRCVLENSMDERGGLEFTCKTSEVVVETLSGYIETDKCVQACGVDRGSVGISSDAFLATGFTARLCSPECYQNCRNIVDLYFNLAAGEGVYLPALCEKQNENPHRSMLALLTSNGVADTVAPGPVIGGLVPPAPAPAPAVF